MKKQRIYVLGHIDLDGITGILGVMAAHPDAHVIRDVADYSNIDSKLLKALTNTKNPYDRIVLVDIAMAPCGKTRESYLDNETRYMAEMNLPAAIADYVGAGGQLVVLDHHPRAEEIAKCYGPVLHPASILERKDHEGIARAGCELAARYYTAERKHTGTTYETAYGVALKDFCRLAGAYDVWRKDEDFKLGSRLAMAQSLMFDDPHGFLLEILDAVENAALRLVNGYDGRMDEAFWRGCFKGHLHDYLVAAEAMFDDELARVRAGSVRHHKRIVEIQSNFFDSLIAEEMYSENNGVCILYYSDKRHGKPKISMRASVRCPVDCSRVASKFGGGGHVFAAGIPGGKASIDEVVAELISELEGHNDQQAA